MSSQNHRRGQISPELLKQLSEQKKNQNKKREWHWSLTVTIAGIIAGSILTFVIKSFTMISYLNLFIVILGIALLAFLIQWKFFYSPAFIQNHFRLPLAIYALYNIGGIAIPFTGILLTLNWAGASGEVEIERHRIMGFDRDYVIDSNFDTPLLLENDAYQDDPEIRSMPYLEAITKIQRPFLDIEYKKGLLGFNIYCGKHMSADPDAKPEVQEEAIGEIPNEELVVSDSTATDSI